MSKSKYFLVFQRPVLSCMLAFLLSLSVPVTAKDKFTDIEYQTGIYTQLRGSYQYLRTGQIDGDDIFADINIGYLFSRRWEIELGYTEIDIALDTEPKRNAESKLIYQSFNYKYPANNLLTLYTKFGLNYADSEIERANLSAEPKENSDIGGLIGFGFYFKFNKWSALVFDYGIHRSEEFVLDALSIGVRFGAN